MISFLMFSDFKSNFPKFFESGLRRDQLSKIFDIRDTSFCLHFSVMYECFHSEKSIFNVNVWVYAGF